MARDGAIRRGGFITRGDTNNDVMCAVGNRDARLDSVLHVRECEYRWRPLRRERYA